MKAKPQACWRLLCVGALWLGMQPAWSASEMTEGGPAPAALSRPTAPGASEPASEARPAVWLSQPAPIYPMVLRASGNSGVVRLSFNVDAQAHVDDIRVLASPHPAFEEAAIDAVLGARYQPAERGGKPVTSRVVAPFEFLLNGEGGPGRADEGVDLFRFPAQGDARGPLEFRYDTPPRLRVMAPLAYPLDLLEKGKSGSAELMVLVSPKGDVDSVRVLSATHPAFGRAAKAAWLSTTFVPARREGQPCWAAFKYVQSFARFDREAPVFAGMADLLGKTGKDATDVHQLPELDAMPRPLHQPKPVYPRRLRDEQVGGKVWVRFIIDKQGKARLPRMARGENAELGALAETAVMRWRFEPPLLKGKPVDVIVVAPLEFSLD